MHVLYSWPAFSEGVCDESILVKGLGLCAERGAALRLPAYCSASHKHHVACSAGNSVIFKCGFFRPPYKGRGGSRR